MNHATSKSRVDAYDATGDRERLYLRLKWKIIPFLFIAFVVAYIDRVNVSFAKLQMLSDLSLSETAYGIGAGVFFIGYFLFELPSNLLLTKVGPRIWIARIMVTWSIISTLTMFVSSAYSFYAMRFILGIAEAGFFPGIVIYLSRWFPSTRRAEIMALFMSAIPVSAAIGGPLSGWIMQYMSGLFGLAGWKWLFLVEGICSLMVGMAAFFVLHDRVDSVSWLDQNEKALLMSDIESDRMGKASHSVAGALLSPKVWLLSLLYFFIAIGNYGLVFWLPTMIRLAGVANVNSIGLLSVIPSIISAVAMILIARHADRHNERRLHVAACCLLGAGGMLLSVYLASNIYLSMLALTVAAIGINSIAPVFWGIPTAMMGGAGAAAAVAVINSTGNLAGFVSPYVIGWLRTSTGQLLPGMFVVAFALLAALLIAISLPTGKRSVDKVLIET